MVVDSSAVVTVLLQEPGFLEFVDAMVASDDPVISATTLVECSIVMAGRSGDVGIEDVDHLLSETGVRVMAVDARQALAAREAWAMYGKGRHPAGLNFGDCFSYALAVTSGRPLLFRGDDFARTDVLAAL